MFVDWVQKLASQDWAAFQSGSVFPLIAVARQEVWTSLVSECRSIVDQYEHEYARRIYWTTEPIVAEEDPRGHTIYKLRVVEKGSRDRAVLELCFDTALPGILYSFLSPIEMSGIIALVLNEHNEVCLSHRGQIVTPEQMAKALLAPILFKVFGFSGGIVPEIMDTAQIRAAYQQNVPLRRPRSLGSPTPEPKARPVPRPPLPDPSLPSPPRTLHPHIWNDYLFALLVTLVTTGLILLMQLTGPLLLFALMSLAVAFTFVKWGVGPGACSLVVAVLATDFFFVAPFYSITLNNTVRILALIYAAVGLLGYWLLSSRRAGVWKRFSSKV